MIQLVAIDIDGTLLDSKGRVPEANREAIAAVTARGVRVVIATGRSFHFALQALDGIPESIALILHNGAIARERGGHTLLRRLLPRHAAHLVLEATLALREHTSAVFDRPAGGQLVYDQDGLDAPQPGTRAEAAVRSLSPRPPVLLFQFLVWGMPLLELYRFCRAGA